MPFPFFLEGMNFFVQQDFFLLALLYVLHFYSLLMPVTCHGHMLTDDNAKVIHNFMLLALGTWPLLLNIMRFNATPCLAVLSP